MSTQEHYRNAATQTLGSLNLQNIELQALLATAQAEAQQLRERVVELEAQLAPDIPEPNATELVDVDDGANE